jgi:hypothetical protein
MSSGYCNCCNQKIIDTNSYSTSSYISPSNVAPITSTSFNSTPYNLPSVTDEYKNVIVQWDKLDCSCIQNDIINLGVEKTDPLMYAQKYGSSLVTADQMPEICNQVQMEHKMPLAAENQDFKYYMELEGDVYALSFIDLVRSTSPGL